VHGSDVYWAENRTIMKAGIDGAGVAPFATLTQVGGIAADAAGCT
jgi:hypothetical protein